MNTENRQGILILGIETSCDETAAALTLDGSTVLSNVILSQIDVHRIYGGVVPEIASRKHVENISFVVEEALRIAGVSKREIGAVAVTCGPGLVGALLVGLSFGKALSYALKKPLIGVNHIEGHVCANYLDNENFQPPFICLVASGGHTHLLEVKAYGEYEVLGRTRDDAAGEAFDKVARSLGLSYPGGPAIDVLAAKGNPSAISLPRAEISGSPYDFSFSGLKSAVLNVLQKMKAADTIGAVDAIGAAGGLPVEDIAASFQQAVVDVLVEKTIRACKSHSAESAALAGGVASNSGLRRVMRDACAQHGIRLHIPKPEYCTDNAAMIAACGYFKWKQGKFSSLDLNANPDLPWESSCGPK